MYMYNIHQSIVSARHDCGSQEIVPPFPRNDRETTENEEDESLSIGISFSRSMSFVLERGF